MTIAYLHVIHSLDPRSGGPAEGVKQLAAEATNLGHNVEIAALDPPTASWARGFACPIHCVGPAYHRYGYAPRLAPWLRENVGRFSAVIVNGIWQYHSLCTWRVLRRSHVPYYVFTHGMLDPWFKRRYPLKHLKKTLYWPWEYRVLRDAAAVLFTSEEELRLARESFTPYEANELVVNYGVPEPPGDLEHQREAFLQKFAHLRGKRIVLFLGRIHPKKGCDLLVRAFASVSARDPALQLVMAGPDQVGQQRSLVELARQLRIDHRITWTGMLEGDAKFGALRAAEVFVLPSHQENFGMAVAEALACATPVLVSKKVNIWREVVADRAGLAGEDSLSGIVELLQGWLDLAQDERSAVAANTRTCFLRRFHIHAAGQSLLTIIQTHHALRQALAA